VTQTGVDELQGSKKGKAEGFQPRAARRTRSWVARGLQGEREAHRRRAM